MDFVTGVIIFLVVAVHGRLFYKAGKAIKERL